MADDDKDGVAEHVRRLLNQEYKDSRYLEVTTAEAVANRVMAWAKLFGFFAGIPLALMAIWLGWLGYTSTKDLEKLHDHIATLEKDVTAKQAQLAKLKELDTIEQRLNSLSSRVSSLESLKFGGSANIGTDAQHRIEDVLRRYQEYFAALGFRFAPNQEVHVQIEKSKAMTEGSIAFYRGDTNTMVIDEKYTASDDVVLREYAHRILLRANPAKSTPGDYNRIGLESGLADYFSRSFAGSPDYTSIPGRTLLNDKKVLPARDYADVQAIGLAWGALGWDLRTKLGRDPVDKLLWTAWQTAPANGSARDFAQALLNGDQTLNHGANADLLRAELAKRGVAM